MSIAVVDTNVILVANGQHETVSPGCVATCARRLLALMRNGKLALDDAFRILGEYQNKTNHRTGKEPGNVFLKWVLQNHANRKRVDLVTLCEHAERGFESFPDDAALAAFDPADRKFVAVACAHRRKPPILQAADSKWLDWQAALERHEVTVELLCPDDLARFRASKLQR